MTYERLNGNYAIDVNHVYYLYDILEGAAPTTFKVLNENYATDMNHVWFNDKVISGADPTTFVIPDGNDSNMSHDAHDYYMADQALHVADISSFKQIDYNWAIDSIQVYYLDSATPADKKAVAIGDYSTFKPLNIYYAVDAKYVYYKNNIVEGADPATFSVLKGEYHYGKDKHRMYYEAYGSAIRDLSTLKHKNMEDGMYDAFHTDGTTVYNYKLLPMPKGTDFVTVHRVEPYRDWYLDKKRVYYENHILPEANPKTFKVLPSHYMSEIEVSTINKSDTYSCDGRHVYYCDSLMSGVDIESFICGYDFVDEQSFAFDKNRYYQGTPSQRTENLRQGKYQVDK